MAVSGGGIGNMIRIPETGMAVGGHFKILKDYNHFDKQKWVERLVPHIGIFIALKAKGKGR